MDGKLKIFITAVISKEPHLPFSRSGVETALAAIHKLSGNQLTNGSKTITQCFSMPQNKLNFPHRRVARTFAASANGGHASKEHKTLSWEPETHRSIVFTGVFHMLNAPDITFNSKMEKIYSQINRMESSR